MTSPAIEAPGLGKHASGDSGDVAGDLSPDVNGAADAGHVADSFAGLDTDVVTELDAVRIGFCLTGAGCCENRKQTEGWEGREPGHEDLLRNACEQYKTVLAQLPNFVLHVGSANLTHTSRALVLRFQRIVPYHSEASDPDVDDRDPAFELVVVGAVHPVGEADGSERRRRLQAGKCRGVIDDVVRDQNFFAAARQKIAGGSIVQAAEDSDAGEQQNVGTVPEGVRRVLGGSIGDWRQASEKALLPVAGPGREMESEPRS